MLKIFAKYKYDFASLGLKTIFLWNKNLESSNFFSLNFFFASSKKFSIICTNLCEKNKIIDKTLKDIEPKNES